MCGKLCSAFLFVPFFLFQVTILPIGLVLTPPFNKLYDWYEMSNFGASPGPEEHKKKVRKIQEQVEEWGRSGRKMCTAKPGWKSFSISKVNKSRNHQIHLDLNEIDIERKVIKVEPGMMMGRLTKMLIPLGWSIPVVPEIETLTVGGLIAGAGIESSSHKEGIFCDIALEYEIVLPDAKVATCSKENDPDLFHAIPGSYGTLGFLTAITLKLIPAKQYVKLDYVFLSSVENVVNVVKRMKANHFFVEGFAFAPDKFVLMFGDMVESAPSSKINLINRWYKPFYYKHAENIMNKLASKEVPSYTEYIPLRDYYHRHSRGYFWVVPGACPIINNSLFMFLFGWVFPINVHFVGFLVPSSILKLTSDTMFQDYCFRMEHLELILSKAHELINIYPIWLCLADLLNKDVNMFKMFNQYPGCVVDYIDIGIYGRAKSPKFHQVETLKYFEKLCIQIKGVLGLYADCYMTNDEFRQMFGTEVYDKVRKERNCSDAFPDVYDKICAKSRQLDG